MTVLSIYLLLLFMPLFGDQTIAFEEAEIKCVERSPSSQGYVWLVRTEAEYKKLLWNRPGYGFCATYKLPKIDFTKRTLMGFQTLVGGCHEPAYEKMVLFDAKRNVYVYTVKIKVQGNCKLGFGKVHWITIPKISPTAKVEFKTDERY